jgi:hypothetical protein
VRNWIGNLLRKRTEAEWRKIEKHVKEAVSGRR